jgi:hypothetical protein
MGQVAIEARSAGFAAAFEAPTVTTDQTNRIVPPPPMRDFRQGRISGKARSDAVGKEIEV